MTKRIVTAVLAVVVGFGAVAVTAPDADAANGLKKAGFSKLANGLKANGL